MRLERDPFRIDLRSAKLCMELDCNTVFDASMYRHCPTCGSVEFYPLESWLNRDRSQKVQSGATVAAFKSGPRALWLGRLRSARAESLARGGAASVRARSRFTQRRRAAV
ncbi:MAG TPA: hypothetical protein VJX92_23765 [Methylomirabilota bacterium]|nr:hypothetical protein [Methylomirabilota bacterium]